MGLLRESSLRDKQFNLLYISVAVLFVALYLILFPRPLPAEFTLTPGDAIPLNELKKSSSLSPGGTFFTLGNWEGYWSVEGKMEQIQARRPRATASGSKISWFNVGENQVVVEGAQGVLFTLPGEQYPHWSQGLLFTLDENRMSLKAYSTQGRVQWSKHFSSLITSIAASENLTVVGTLDGKIQLFDTRGEVAGGFQPGGSRLPVVYNVSVSPSGERVLALAGVDPKRFLVLERGGADFRPVFHKPLKESRPWPTPLGFLNGGTLAYYETELGLAFLDPKSPQDEVIVPTQGSPVVLESLPGGALVAFVQREGDRAALRIASISGASVFTLPFSARDLLLKVQADSLFLGVDQTLLRLEVRIQ